MAADFSLGVTRFPVAQNLIKRLHLSIGELRSANQADAKAFVIMFIDMSADPIIRAAMFNRAVTVDDPVIPHPVPAETKMHFMQIKGGQVFIVRGVGSWHHQITDRVGIKIVRHVQPSKACQQSLIMVILPQA